VATPTAHIRQAATHRLIPARHTGGDESVLARLTDRPGDLQALFDLESATNDRLLGEANLLPGISVHELVFGTPNWHIVNGSFCHAAPHGSRFNRPDRGCWYAGFDFATAQVEVGFHFAEGLREVKWPEPETAVYRDYLADFNSEFHDLRHGPRFSPYLNPDSYVASQRFARQLLDEGSAGVVYPSVRRSGGTCIACFRPALVGNVRKGRTVTMTFTSADEPPRIKTT